MFHLFVEMVDDVVDFENANKNMKTDDVYENITIYFWIIRFRFITECIYVEEIIDIVLRENLVNS